MRVSSEEEMKRFEAFDAELSRLGDIDPLKEVSSTSPHTLQIVVFHLIFEYLVEKWIDCKINHGNQVFSGIGKIGFHNKLYIAKNIGLPKPIFQALNRVNIERNKFAHQISNKLVSKKEIMEIAELANNIDCTGGKFENLGVYENGKLVHASETDCEKTLLLLALHALLGKLRNFVFMDIHLSTSRECKP
jgi:hypothetical protein